MKKFLEKMCKNLSPGLVFMLVVGILLLALSNSFEKQEKASDDGLNGKGLISIGTTEKTQDISLENKTEERFRTLLEGINGVGKCRVMLANEQTGVCIVCEGADDPEVAKEIINISMALFDIPAHKVIIVKLEGD